MKKGLCCPTLAQLPPPPPGKTGWPWTAESSILPQTKRDGKTWPLISVVTPSYNQAAFLEATIRSVLLQGYPNLEYVIIDGGSTDDSQEIIHKYAPWLTHWTSEPDDGQYSAINHGFKYTKGEIMAWLNSDDMYLPNAFKTVGEVFTVLCHSVQWITGVPTYWDEYGYIFSVQMFPRFSSRHIRLGFHDERGLPAIQQESTFWSRQLWLDTGGQLDTGFKFAADYDLWRKFAAKAELYLVNVPLGGFRVHGNQKTAFYLNNYYAEVDQSLSKDKLLWLNRVLKTAQGQRVLKFYNKFRRCSAVISYNLDTGCWEEVTWEISR